MSGPDPQQCSEPSVAHEESHSPPVFNTASVVWQQHC